MRTFNRRFSGSLAFLSGLVFATPLLAQEASQPIATPNTLAAHLTLGGVYADASLIMKAVLWGLTLAIFAALAVWLTQLVRLIQGRSDGAERALAYLAAQSAAAPLFGAFGLSYAALNGCIGIANVRPSANLTVLAPGLAEAFLSLGLGLLAAAIATVGQAHLKARLSPGSMAHAPSTSPPPMARVAA